MSTAVDISADTVEGSTGPVPVRDYRPLVLSPEATPFLWVHGGGFASGGLDQTESDAVAKAIAKRGRWVRTVDYRLVPQFPLRASGRYAPSDNRFPAPLDDVTSVFLDMGSTYGTPVLIGGASAGACLVAGAMMRLRDAGASLPAAVALAYGTFHGELPPLSAEIRSRTRLPAGLFQFSSALVHRMNYNYVGSDEGMQDHQAFPGGGDLTLFPPAMLLDADRDTLRASGERFATELTDHGVEIERHVYRGSRHGFFNRDRSLFFARGIDHLSEWLEKHDLQSTDRKVRT